MDLRSIVPDLSQKGVLAKDIHFDTVPALGLVAVGYCTVTLCLPDERCAGPMDLEAAPEHDHEPDDSDQAISAALSHQTFASVRELSGFAHVSSQSCTDI
jgi:hypothetical protein